MSRQQRTTYEKNCEVCYEPFTSHRQHARFCSPKCRRRAARPGVELWIAKRTCTVCGDWFYPKSPASGGRYCSASCKQKAWRARRKAAQGDE